MIRKRYFHMSPELLKHYPTITEPDAHSLSDRQSISIKEVPILAKEAAMKAIKEWGQPMSKITHLIFCTTSCIDMPGADYQLTKLLNLSPSIKRSMIYNQGCFAGGTALRLAKDFAENNADARVLIVCCEIGLLALQSPSSGRINNLINSALFGDGAAAVIVGADPDLSIERPIFEIMSAEQVLIPDSEGGIEAHLYERGLEVYIRDDVPFLISKNIEKLMKDSFDQIGISDWNSLFWIMHPGGPSIMNQVQMKLQLDEDKLRVSRHVLSEFGNMSSPTVLFAMDEMRKRSLQDGKGTTGDGLEWGVLIGLGPGLTAEIQVLRSVSTE